MFYYNLHIYATNTAPGFLMVEHQYLFAVTALHLKYYTGPINF